MDWQIMYLENNKPTFEQIGEYINDPLWHDLNDTLTSTYNVEPQVEYSSCSAQRGWNVKYKKKSKSLCTLYPEQGYYIALLVLSERLTDINLYIENCGDYIKKMYHDTKCFNGSKWLMINIKDKSTLEDVKDLIAIRAK